MASRESRAESLGAVLKLVAFVGAFFVAAAAMFGVAYLLGPESLNSGLQWLLTTFLATYGLVAFGLVRLIRMYQHRYLGTRFRGGVIEDPPLARARPASPEEPLVLVVVVIILVALAWYAHTQLPESALDAHGLQGDAFLGIYALLGRTGAVAVLLLAAAIAATRSWRSWRGR